MIDHKGMEASAARIGPGLLIEHEQQNNTIQERRAK
jgi:hypothetical protein